jgi:DNA-binding MarR family transcriptional regulator
VTPPQLSPPEAAAWSGLLRTHAALVRDVDGDLRAAHGLPLAWYDVLCELAEAPGRRMRMGELAARVRLTRAGLTGLVDRLEARGLVERRPCDGDARGTYAVATAEGMRQLEVAHTTHRDAIRRRYTGRLTRAQLEQLGGVWRRLLPR